MVLLVVFNGNGIDEKSLNEAYHRYIGAPEKSNLSGKRDFYAALRLMTGAMLNRTVDDDGDRRITTFNPSIADFVLRRFENDCRVVADAASSLRSFASIHVLEGLKRNDRLKPDAINWITSFILEKLVTDNFEGVLGQSYVAALTALFYETRPLHVTTPRSALAAIYFVLERPDQGYYRTLDLIHMAAKLGDINSKDVADFLTACVTTITNDLETVRYASLLKFVEDHEEREILQHAFHEHVIDRASADVDDFLDPASVFAEADEVDHENAYGLLHDAVEQRFRMLGVDPDDTDFASKILEDFDCSGAVDRFLNRFEAEEIEPQDDVNDADGMDAVDDLFQKDD